VLTLVTISFGLPPWILIVYEAADAAVNVFSHANVRLPERFDRVLRWVFVTPNMHSLHHSSHQPETDSNYGAVFTFWDRLFGTYQAGPAEGYGKLQIGLKEIRDDRVWQFWWQMKSPALLFFGKSSPRDVRRFGRAALCAGRTPADLGEVV